MPKPTGFFTRPISATLLIVFVLVAVLPGIRTLLAKWTTAPSEQPITTKIKEKV
ncbi:hypothetical protein [Arthrobacter sp. I3]|uniref:hypothetical protein n=1 Tax=Arthrobacter sp. I3 TaxID=218158 RepID=UPI0004B87F65|nr:hypothetical protein [Arthrobacter sp. I3]